MVIGWQKLLVVLISRHPPPISVKYTFLNYRKRNSQGKAGKIYCRHKWKRFQEEAGRAAACPTYIRSIGILQNASRIGAVRRLDWF
jgi:hypothetical protein